MCAYILFYFTCSLQLLKNVTEKKTTTVVVVEDMQNKNLIEEQCVHVFFN